MVELTGIFDKVIGIILIAAVFPMTMVALNEMNVTGFTPTQTVFASLFGLVVAFVFLRMIMKE